MRPLPRWTLLLAVTLGVPGILAQASDSESDDLKSSDPGRRAKAARELGNRGDPASVPALAGVVSDPQLKVRREVVIALSSIQVPETLDPLVTATRDSDPEIRELAVDGLVGYYTGRGPDTGFFGFWKRTWRVARGRFIEENVRIDPGVRVEAKVVAALLDAMRDERVLPAARKAADGLGILVAPAAVPQLVKAAYSPDKDLALIALNALAKIKDLTAGPELLKLLDSPDRDVKQEAAVTLGILRTREALPRLQAIYENDPDRRTREKALEGLGYLGDPVSVPFLIKALWDPRDTVRTSAAEGLARAADKKALAELEKAIQVERDGDARLAMQFAITALGKEDFLSAVVNELGSTRRGDAAQTYLIELSQKQEFVPRLYPYTNSQDAEVRRRLCIVLMFTGDPTSVEHLERLSRDPNDDVATEALRALRAVRVRNAA